MGSVADQPHSLDHLLQGLPVKNLEALWPKMSAMVPGSPNPTAKPYIWKYNEVLPDLLAAGKLVPAEQAERRVLMLVNPSMRESRITPHERA
jgi:gentisate 1,2-dioxygenase